MVGSLFSNMDSKWLRSYERAALYGETLKIIDYSPNRKSTVMVKKEEVKHWYDGFIFWKGKRYILIREGNVDGAIGG